MDDKEKKGNKNHFFY